MKRIQLLIEVEEDHLAFEAGMGVHMSLQSEVGAAAVITALLHCAESMQRQVMIQENEAEDPSADADHRAVYAGLAARLALVDSVMHLPPHPVAGFVVDVE